MTNLQLLRSSRFGPFFTTQFLGAFNDNFFKNALVVLITFHTTTWTTMAPATLALIASAIFMLPFFLGSAIAGQIADKYRRDVIAQYVKRFEIGIMLFSLFGFYYHSVPLLLGALFLFGIHSAFFGPVKYAILPQHLHPDELLAGNALIEGGTFIAILFGTIFGALVASLSSIWWIPSIGLTIAILGYLISKKIPIADGPSPDLGINYNPITATWQTIKKAMIVPSVFQNILAISWFWALGLLYLSQFPVISKEILHGNEITVSLLLGLFSIGIGIGSIVCEKMSHHHVNMQPVRYATIALGIGTLLFGGLLHSYASIYVLSTVTLALGIAGGFFCVPLYTAMQQNAPQESRAQVIACNNVMNSFFMVIAAGFQGILLPYLGISGLFLLFGGFQLVSYIGIRKMN